MEKNESKNLDDVFEVLKEIEKEFIQFKKTRKSYDKMLKDIVERIKNLENKEADKNLD